MHFQYKYMFNLHACCKCIRELGSTHYRDSIKNMTAPTYSMYYRLSCIKSTMNTFKLHTSIIVYFVRHDNC